MNISKILPIDTKGIVMKTKLLVEQHFHGCYGVDFNKATSEDILDLSYKMRKEGFGAIFPTLVTDTIENILFNINNVGIKIVYTAKFFIKILKLENLIVALKNNNITVIYIEDIENSFTIFNQIAAFLKSFFPRTYYKNICSNFERIGRNAVYLHSNPLQVGFGRLLKRRPAPDGYSCARLLSLLVSGANIIIIFEIWCNLGQLLGNF